MTSLTPLRVRSHGSLLYGTASPERLVARALELGYRALALTDRDNLYLAIRFLQHARSEGCARSSAPPSPRAITRRCCSRSTAAAMRTCARSSRTAGSTTAST